MDTRLRSRTCMIHSWRLKEPFHRRMTNSRFKKPSSGKGILRLTAAILSQLASDNLDTYDIERNYEIPR